jgi:hypothetical protein
MKKIYSFLFILTLLNVSINGQYYYVPGLSNGNPGGLNSDDEYSNTWSGDGWTSILGPSVASPTWSANQTIPFSFNFNGSPVTEYKVSSTGVLTFTTSASSVPGTTNAAIPDATIPDKSVCIWGLICSGSNDEIVIKTFGTAPNRQQWIYFPSNTLGGAGWTYMSIVLEETTDKIYIVEQRNYNNSGTVTAGIQIDGTTAVSIGGSSSYTPLVGNSSSYSDNVYYEFNYGTQPTYDVAGVSMTTFPYLVLGNAPFDVSGEVVNYGSSTITSMDINYSVNGGATVTESLSGLNIAMFDTYSFTHGTGWTPTAIGNYQIDIWASNINGNADMNTTNDLASGNVDVLNSSTQRTPLFETFTSSTCGPCVAGNAQLDVIFSANPNKYTSIKYQMDWPGAGDPYYTDEGGDRKSFYGVSSVPRLEIDGGWDSNPSDLTQQDFDDYYIIPAFTDLAATYSVGGQAVQVDVTIDPLENIPSNNLVVHIAVFEYLTYNNVGSNGEIEFHHVMKKMLPNASGTSIASLQSSVQQTVSKSYNFNGSYVLPADAQTPVNHSTEHTVEEFTDLGVAVWIQDEVTKEIFQSTTGSLVAGINNQNEQLLSAKVYPNPVTDNATLAFYLKESGDVTIKIHNSLGQEVFESYLNNQSFGRSTTQLNTSELPTGLYTITLITNNERIVKKMQVLK